MSNPEVNNEIKKEERNNSGQGPTAKAPAMVANRFNWGAFFLTWIWGCFHKQFLTLLIFLPAIFSFLFQKDQVVQLVCAVASLGLSIWFGIKGNEWAWQGRHYDSIAQFHESQKKWAIAGIILTVLWTVLIIIAIVFFTIMFVNALSGLKY